MKNKLIAEGIGTYFLYLLISLCLTPPTAGDFTPLAVAIGLTALVYSCGHLSKAHFNPATTIAYFCAGTHNRTAFLPYVAVIFASALMAAGTTQYLFSQEISDIIPAELDLKQALVGEFLFTFILMWVILNVAIAKGTSGNAFYGIAIGAIVGAGAYAVGTISFAAFNPAVTLGLCVNGFLPWEALLPYCAVQASAAALAGCLFRSMQITNPDELPA